jgi:hypothetical protein
MGRTAVFCWSLEHRITCCKVKLLWLGFGGPVSLHRHISSSTACLALQSLQAGGCIVL